MLRKSVAPRLAEALSASRGSSRLLDSLGIHEVRSLVANHDVRSNFKHFGEARDSESCSCGGTCPACSVKLDHYSALLTDASQDEGATEDQGLVGHCPAEERLSSSSDGYVHNGAATVVCDGAGDYRVQMNSWAGAPCGIEDCVRRHEESHIGDLRVRYPDGCKNSDGTPKRDGTPHPRGGSGYDSWLKKSECKAYTTEIACQEANLKTANADCKTKIEDHLKADRAEKERYCGGGC